MDEELFQRMQEAAARFRAGESDVEEILTPIGPARLVRDASDPRGFRIDFVDGGSRHVVPVQRYPAAPTRPPGYPAPLPFLPRCAAVVDTATQSVTWTVPADADGAVEHLRRESLDDAWTSIPEAGSARPDGTQWALEKDGVVRTLVRESVDGQTRLVLREHRPD